MSETLELTVEIAAKPETVFGHFTDADAFAVWMGGAMGAASIEPREGGALRIEFLGGRLVRGEVVAIEPPRRFAFTWGYEGDPAFPPGSSTVEIRLEAAARGTRLRLRHDGLPDSEQMEAHRGGFRLYLSRLAAEAAVAEHAPRLDGLVEAWFRAWNAEAPADRLRALADCVADDGEFRHPWAALSGRDALAGHIASSRSVMQGIRLEPLGEPELCHRWVRFGWRAVQDGAPVSTGENVGALGADGRFDLVIGFTDPVPR